MKKIARVYLSTFVDVEIDSDDYSSKEEVKEYIEHNLSDYITPEEVYENICTEPTDIDIW